MPLSDEVRSLLLKYIAGETDEEESKMVEAWLSNNPKLFKEFEQLWDLWYAVGTATNVFHFNVDKGWETVLNKGFEKSANNKKNDIFRRIMIWGGSVAAIILLFIALTLWYKTGSNNTGTQQNNVVLSSMRMIEKDKDSVLNTSDLVVKTRPGERKQIRLPDNSLVWLNGGTKIHFTSKEKSNERILYLSGQAFFSIKHNANRPFIVKTTHASIKVLGTRFDVTAYPGDPLTEAILTQGSILFTTKSNDKKVSRQIVPGEKVSINYLSGRFKINEVDTAFYASWKEGKLLFRNETFGEVARAMEHKYNVTIQFRDTALCKKKLNGYLDKESLQEALKALKLALQFQYKIEENKVLIYQ